MENTRESFPPHTGSMHSPSSDNYLITVNGVPYPDVDVYRHRGEKNYSPSESRSPSGSPLVACDGDDFSGFPFGSLSNDEMLQCIYYSSILEPEPHPPDQNPSNVTNIQPRYPPYLSSFLPETFLPQSDIPDIGTGSDYFTNNMGHQIPIEGTSDSPSPVHLTMNSENNEGRLNNVCPQTAPLSYDYPTAPRCSRTRSEPVPFPERPFMTANPHDPYPDVFLPDSPQSPSVPWDKMWDGYSLDGVLASGICSLGPGHHVSGESLLSLPKRTHCRRRSDGGVISQGAEGGWNLAGPSRVADAMGHLHLSPTHDVFAGGPPTSPKVYNASPETASPQLLPTTHSAASDDLLEGPSSFQGFLSASGSAFSLSSPEDEGRSQTLSSEWLAGNLSGAEEPASPSRPSRIVKRDVTTRAMRMASNARMRSLARFTCHLCQQSLTTKGGLRNHINSHLGVKRFRCSLPYCRKPFTTKWVCTRHERTVHGLLV